MEFPEPFVRAAVNQGLYRLNILTGFSNLTASIPGGTTAGQREYQTPNSILIPLRVDIEGAEIDRVSLARLARAYRTWAVDATDGLGPVARWASIGLRTFVIHPIDSQGGSSLEVTGVAKITPLAAPEDVVQLNDAFQEILISYARTHVMAKEPGKPFADMAIALRDLWQSVRSMAIWQGVEYPDFWLRRQARPATSRGGR